MAYRTVYSKSMKTYADPKNDPLWKETYSLVEYMYGKQEEITAKSPDERWITASKIRTLANDVMFYVSLAVGSSLSYTAEYEWNSARKNLFTLQAEYVFAGKQGFLETDNAIVGQIDTLMQKMSDRLQEAQQAIKGKDREDLKPWLEKHKLWKEMQEK